MLRSRLSRITMRGSGRSGPRPSFWAPLITSTVSTANQAGTYTNASASGTRSIADWEGVLRTVLSGESRHGGARRVQNLFASNTTTLNVAANQTVTVGVGTYVFSMGAGTGTITFTGTATGATGSLAANATNRTATTLTITVGGTIICTASVATCNTIQIENVTGQSNQNPGEYVPVGVASAPYYGVNVDGVQLFATQNGNIVASNVVTAGTGAAIPTATLLGYLSEPAATNLILQSSDLNTTWAKTNATINATKVLGPRGTLTAQKIEETTSGSTPHRVEQNLVKAASATLYTCSASLKPAERTWAIILLTNIAGTAYSYCFINLATGALGTSGNVGAYVVGTPSVKSRANGFWRLSVPITTDAATETNLYVYSTTGDNVFANVGTAGNGIYCEDIQLETGGIGTSEILTTTVAVTRNKDLDSYATAGNVNTNDITISTTWTPGASPSANGTVYLWGSYVDASNYTLIFHDGTNIVVRKRIAGANTDATKALSYTAGTSYRIAGRFSSVTGIDVFVDGVIGTNSANTAALQLGSTFQIGADGNGTVGGVQYQKNDKIFPSALSAAQVAGIPL